MWTILKQICQQSLRRLPHSVRFRVSKGREVPGQSEMGHPIVTLFQDKTVFLSRCPIVPGQKSFLVPLSLCPGTTAAAKIPGQTPLSREKTTI